MPGTCWKIPCTKVSGPGGVWLWWPLPAPGPRLPGCSRLPPAPGHVMGGAQPDLWRTSKGLCACQPCSVCSSAIYWCAVASLYLQSSPVCVPTHASLAFAKIASCCPLLPSCAHEEHHPAPHPSPDPREEGSVTGEFGKMNRETPAPPSGFLLRASPAAERNLRSKNGACVQRRPAVPSVWPP